MSCWVVPSVAAEIWGMSVESVWAKVASGEIPHRMDEGWTFVDCAPSGPVFCPPKLAPDERPPTWTMIADQELTALADVPAAAESHSFAAEISEEEDPNPDPEPEVSNFKHWRTARQRTAKMRLAPPRFSSV